MNDFAIEKAKEHFYKKEYDKALPLFMEAEDFYGAGLSSLLLKDIEGARKYWQKKKNDCPASDFGLCILDFIQLKEGKLPTFFQTRAQLEIYLNLFIENNLIEYAENLISSCDKFYMSNPEAYKFIARVLFSNGYCKLAITFCRKTLKLYYCDPEAFLILAQCHFLLGDLGEALDCVNRTIDMVPEYYPAKLLKNVLKEEIDKKRYK